MPRIFNKYTLFTLIILGLIASFVSVVASVTKNESGVDVSWGYKGNNGPAHWGQLSPSFVICAAGKSQSPINIIKHDKSASNTLSFHYAPAQMVIINDGTTNLTLAHTQTIVDDGHSIQVNFPHRIQVNFPTDSSNETLTFANKSYRLIQFHIHTPSENEWHGQAYPMEIHFVHQGANGQAAVLGVFVKGGQPNAALQKLIDNLPKEKGKEYVIPGMSINPIDLLPIKQDHYYFKGSLTTPPCTEGLQWIVMANAITASPAQIVELRKAVDGANARPVQPLNGRTIFYSTGSK